jgi:hypothetical protein
MSEAVIGLIGVVVGAGLTSVTQWWFLRIAAKDRRRVALRLLRNELDSNHVTLQVAAQYRFWWTEGSLESSVLDQYRADLAHVLSDAEWEEVSKVSSILSIPKAQREKMARVAAQSGMAELPQLNDQQLEIVDFCARGLEGVIEKLSRKQPVVEPARA